jgi:hypothetical protein
VNYFKKFASPLKIKVGFVLRTGMVIGTLFRLLRPLLEILETPMNQETWPQSDLALGKLLACCEDRRIRSTFSEAGSTRNLRSGSHLL